MSSDFPSVPLGDLTVNYDYKRKPVKSSDRKAGPYPYYGASGVVDFVDSYLFDGEYLLIGEDGENMRTRQTPIAFIAKGKFWVNNHAHIVKANERSTTKYLKYALAVTDISTYLTGAVMPKLTQGNMNQILIPCPPLDTQNKIVGLLGCLDDSIEVLQHQNTALEAIAQRLFRSWFVNFDPVHAKAAGKEPEAMSAELAALFPSEFEDSELGPIPKGWSVTTFGDAFDIKGGATPSTSEPLYWEGGTHAWATPKDMSSLASKVMYRTERQITAAGVAKISSKALPSGTVLMSSRAPVGYLAIAKAPISINQGFIAIPPTPGIPASFAVELLAHKMPDIKANAGGTTFAEISKTQFRPIKWTRPSDKVLEAFGKLVEPLYAQVHGNCLLVDSLASLRDHLLPRLISGKLSLEEAERVTEEAVSV